MIHSFPPDGATSLSLAARHMVASAPATCCTASASVNDSYVRPFSARKVSWEDGAHFFALTPQVMRRILVGQRGVYAMRSGR